MRTLPTRAMALSLVWMAACAVDQPSEEGGAEASESGGTSRGESSSETQSETDSSSEAESGSETETDSETEPETETETGPETETGSEAESGSATTDPDCESGTLDCPCDMGSCEGELTCTDDLCTPPACGDGNVDPGEECDDGNELDNDGCESDCSITTTVVQIAAASIHTCVRTSTGEVYCWGDFNDGRLGLPSLTESVGDDELPSEANLEPLQLGGPATALMAGDAHTCALIEGGEVVCWGNGNFGKLGYGNVADVGDNEAPIAAGFVELPEPVETLAVGDDTTCVILESGELRCWGTGTHGKLGLGDTEHVGDDETPAQVPPVDLGGPVAAVGAYGSHTCALTEAGDLYCWGFNLSGQLGLGHTLTIGDDEPPTATGPVDVGAPVAQITAGLQHTCVLTEAGNVRCWGRADSGQLGTGNEEYIGDDELPSVLEDVDLGGVAATALVTGARHNCALLVDGKVRCWGSSGFGVLGSGDNENVGDDELPTDVDPVEIGGLVEVLGCTNRHSCVVTQSGGLRCWGPGGGGRLGYGDTETIGDDELPIAAGEVSLF